MVLHLSIACYSICYVKVWAAYRLERQLHKRSVVQLSYLILGPVIPHPRGVDSISQDAAGFWRWRRDIAR